MKNKIFLILGISIIFFSTSCTKKFDEINTNPNNPDTAPAENVFAYSIQRVSSCFGTTEMEYAASYVGHVTKGSYTDIPNYAQIPSTAIWNNVYGTIVPNLNYVIKKAQEEENNNLEAASMILKVYAFQLVTDIYGKVPYTEAGLAEEGIIHPSYDSEQTIYTDLMQQLDIANDMLVNSIANGVISSDADLLYGGNIDRWKKFCNSLHLRLAIRISNIDQSTASSEISKIINDPSKYPIFETNNDNAVFVYPGGDWVEPWTARHRSIGDDWAAKPIIDTLVNFADPRIAFYADTLDDGTYSGLPVGAQADTIYSRVNDLFVENETGSVYFLTYSEIQFIIAEAAARNFITSDAQTAYEEAITASCKVFNIGNADIANYLANANVAWDGDVNKIYIQKWISLFRQSWEAWAEMRRTDIPTLTPAVNSNYPGHNRVPFRFSYPDSEILLNSGNIPTDVNEVDNYWGYRIWWDTRTGVQ